MTHQSTPSTAHAGRLSRVSRSLALALSLSVGWVGLASTAQAGGISAQAVARAAAQSGTAQQRLLANFDRDEVRQALVDRGVDLEQARARVAALSDEQAATLLAEIDQAPAGADGIIDLAVFVFLVLLVTDILGFTKVFPFTRSIR
ncbi:MAG: hypothetical protein RIQ60_136 [Pseudomonadota bacterium]|jgi:hypothetical protein